MIKQRHRLEELVETSLRTCQSWLVEDAEGGLRLIDPLDGRAISAHYGDSHLAAALFILGKSRNDAVLINQGLKLVRTVIRDWPKSCTLIDFHQDFNNFALCVIEELVENAYDDLSKEIKKLILSARDSSHDTINWHPMRAYVNRSRFEWSNEAKFQDAYYKSIASIQQATNADGGIEDRLPIGSSYNLQYNVSSLATLQLIEKRWRDLGLDLSASLDFLQQNVLPDGDINYLGRGTNQIFAWGPWLYSLSLAHRECGLSAALDFLSERYATAAGNSNILLNEFQGSEKSFWWDYHYCSVYHAHFLFWSVLALRDYASEPSLLIEEIGSGTGLSLTREDFGGAAVFSGRSTYLAESGPSVCALWLSELGVLFKGGYGPWKGMFGNKYSFPEAVFQNHIGLVSVEKKQRPFIESRVVRKLLGAKADDRQVQIRPEFADIHVEPGQASLSIVFSTSDISAYLNVPIFEEFYSCVRIELSVDGQKLESKRVGKSLNQYGWVDINRSVLGKGKRWKIEIFLASEGK